MATLAETYYLKALENYPWELSEAMENLIYALSYEQNHAAANCLMGKLQLYSLKNYALAETYFENAINADSEYACAYENLVTLYITTGKLKKAQQVLVYCQRLPTVNQSIILGNMALILEKQHQLKLAKAYLKEALMQVICTDEQERWNLALSRVKTKLKAQKKRAA